MASSFNSKNLKGNTMCLMCVECPGITTRSPVSVSYIEITGVKGNEINFKCLPWGNVWSKALTKKDKRANGLLLHW